MNLPDWLDIQSWEDWLEDRKLRGLKNTPHSITRQLNILEKQKHLQKEIIDNSINNGYRGLFNIRESDHREKYINNDDWIRMGEEIGLQAKPGESMSAYKTRIKERMN